MNNQLQSIPINRDDIHIYLKDLRKLKVMTHEREKELSEMMKKSTLTPIQQELIEKELIEGNLRFVITVAKQYQNKGLDLSDLIAEGNLGLIKAIRIFDWNKNLRFISYAVWWVKQSILQALNDHARTIRLPVNVVQELNREQKLFDNGVKSLADKFAVLPSMVYLDKTINDDGDTMMDIIVNSNSNEPDSIFHNNDIITTNLNNILTLLDYRERIIIEDYFGLMGSARTLEEIGEELSLTKERVRQIKEKSLRKLRNEGAALLTYI